LDGLALWLRFYLHEGIFVFRRLFSPSGLLIGRALHRVGVGLPGAAARLLLG